MYLKIRKQILSTCDPSKTIEINNRKNAIEQTIAMLENNDILIIAGREGRGYLQAELKKTGIPYLALEVYQRIPNPQLPPQPHAAVPDERIPRTLIAVLTCSLPTPPRRPLGSHRSASVLRHGTSNPMSEHAPRPRHPQSTPRVCPEPT